MDKDELKQLLKQHLKIRTITECRGHMAPIVLWVELQFDGETICKERVLEEAAEDSRISFLES